MTALSQRIEMHQAQKLSPRLQHAVRLLQMSSLDFMQEVHAMIDSNPFLEGAETDPPHESHDAEREPWLADGRGASAPRVATDGGDLESLGSVAVSVTLVEHLHRQLNMITLPLRDAVLAKALMGSLDDDGYLRTPLDEIAAMADLSPRRSRRCASRCGACSRWNPPAWPRATSRSACCCRPPNSTNPR